MSRPIQNGDYVMISDPTTRAKSPYIIRNIDNILSIYISPLENEEPLSLLIADKSTGRYVVYGSQIPYGIEFVSKDVVEFKSMPKTENDRIREVTDIFGRIVWNVNTPIGTATYNDPYLGIIPIPQYIKDRMLLSSDQTTGTIIFDLPENQYTDSENIRVTSIGFMSEGYPVSNILAMLGFWFNHELRNENKTIGDTFDLVRFGGFEIKVEHGLHGRFYDIKVLLN